MRCNQIVWRRLLCRLMLWIGWRWRRCCLSSTRMYSGLAAVHWLCCNGRCDHSRQRRWWNRCGYSCLVTDHSNGRTGRRLCLHFCLHHCVRKRQKKNKENCVLVGHFDEYVWLKEKDDLLMVWMSVILGCVFLTWRNRFPFPMNAFPHWLQPNGFSPVCNGIVISN